MVLAPGERFALMLQSFVTLRQDRRSLARHIAGLMPSTPAGRMVAAGCARRGGLAALFGAVVGLGLYGLCYRSMVDDAFITLDYARQLGLHGRWGMVDGLAANSATSPLSVLALGALTRLTQNAIAAVGVLLVSCFVLASQWLLRLGGPVAAGVGIGWLASCPLLASTVGLESYLAITLLIGLAAFAEANRWSIVGMLAGLLILTRPDLGVIAVIAVVVARGDWWRAAAAAVGATLPWLVWSWFVLGSAIPDTFLIKVGSGGWGDRSFALWFMLYLPRFPTAVILSLIPAVAGVVCLPMWWRRAVGWLWGGGALAHYLTMQVLNAGLYHWYAAPSVAGFGLLAVLTLARWHGRARPTLIRCAFAFVMICVVWLLSTGVPRERTPIGSNWASTDEYRRIAATLPRGATILSPGEIGTLAYYCDCRVVDEFADRGYLPRLLDDRRAATSGLGRALLDLNYARFRHVAPQPLDWRMTARLDRASANPPMHGAWGEGRTVALTPVAARQR